MAVLRHHDGTVSRLDFLENDEFAVVGKSQKADIRISGSGVRGVHCHIINLYDRYYIRPVSKSGAVFVNNSRLTKKEMLLEPGFLINLGDWRMRFEPKSSAGLLPEGAPLESAVELTTSVSKRKTSLEIQKQVLKQQIHQQLLDRMDLKSLQKGEEGDDVDELRHRAKKLITHLLNEFSEQWSLLNLDRDAFYQEVLDDVLGLGPLEVLLRDDTISEIMVGAGRKIFVERNGQIEKLEQSFYSTDQLLTVIERIVGPLGRRIDESSPLVDARLSDGSRVNAVISPIALDSPSLDIRKFSKNTLKAQDLIQYGTLTQQMADFLKLAVSQRKNMIISGGTGSGKTTLLNIISSFISHRERIVTIEDSAELQLEQEHVIRLEARPPNVEGRGEVDIRALVRNALRMRPDRIIVGECRGGESLDMLQAMNTGHDGSLTTVHANTPKDVISRLETMVLMSGVDLPTRAIHKQISSAVHIICQQSRLPDGSRKIMSIAEMTYIEDEDLFDLQDIFVFKQDGFDLKTGRVNGRFMPTGAIPRFVTNLLKRGVDVDMSMFVVGE